MMENTTQVNSLKELQVLMPRILEAINQDKSLVLAAASNPLLALEKMGYVLRPEAKTEIELHIRFGKTKAKEVAKLEKEVYAVAGKAIDLDNNQEVSQLIRKILIQPKEYKVDKTAKATYGKSKQVLSKAVLGFLKKPLSASFHSKEFDKSILNQLNLEYPLVAQLVRYRTWQSKRPQFGSREVFEKILNGGNSTLITGIKFRLQDRNIRKKIK